ncbi:DUF559 domain-containing protein [Actinomyces ruminicola]|uniref:DUF559 domain-containing protein n=1 Tax=Actinomyces ruminicola TaxID=332524 RepID=UPI001FE07CD4|nr:DUF559 domain-containing protein [Actinomyces ruminicola]
MDGYTYHEDEFQFARDRNRDRELVRQGYRVARFTRKDVELGRVGAEIHQLLAARNRAAKTVADRHKRAVSADPHGVKRWNDAGADSA